MVRISSVTKKLSKVGGKVNIGGSSFSFLWIVALILIVVIILFAFFHPKSDGHSSAPLIPENFANSEYKGLMENYGNDEVDITEISSSKTPTFVMFYAPWCGHCKSAKPEFEKFMKKLETEGSKVKAVMIDCEENKDMARKYDVQGFPTFKLFPNGMSGSGVKEYNGARSIDGWASFVNGA